MKIRVRTNLLAGVLSVVFAAVIWFMIPYQIPATSDVVAQNPRLLPQFVCVAIALVGAVLIVSSTLLRREDIKEYKLPVEGRRLLYYLILAAYVILMRFIGFLPASLLFAGGSLAYFRCKKPLYYMVILLFGAGIYLVFRYVLHVRFP